MELKAHELYKKILLSLSKSSFKQRETGLSKYFSTSLLAHRNRLTVAIPIDF